MKLAYSVATAEDIPVLYRFCKKLIDDYEDITTIDYDKVLCWVRRKLELCIGEYTVISADGRKAGYYHFFRNEDGIPELDDLYLFPEFQNQGIGSAVIEKCCDEVSEPVMLYVFIRNNRAVSLYQRLGFEIVETIKESRYIMKRTKPA